MIATEKKRSNSGESNLRKILTLSSLGLTLKKINPAQIINRNLQPHDTDVTKHNVKVINDIIYDEKKHIVCVFKDFLLWDENSDFLKR